MTATRSNGETTDKGKQRAGTQRVVVKFRDGAQIPSGGEIGKFLDEKGIGPWAKLVDEFPGIKIRPRFDEFGNKQLSELVAKAMELDPTYRPPHFPSFAAIEVPNKIDPHVVAASIAKWSLVEEAFVDPGPTDPPVMAIDDPRSMNQGYLDPAPDGIDAEYAWTRPGGDGAGVGFVDLERGWTLNHEDLAAAGITVISGVSTDFFGHGTAVLGEVVSVDNTLGGIGIAPEANARVVSQWRSDGSYDTAEAILSAAAVMDFGDVLLLEAQTTHAAMAGFLPVEVATDAFEAIRLATALGIIVVEAAANGSNNLDNFTTGGVQPLNRSNPGFRDSGAIMVGAGSAATPHTRLNFSNFGSRIDCYGWGGGIDTTGDGWTGNLTTTYTTSFGGTSGASPIIVGAALLLQSISIALQGFRYSPAQMRSMVTNPATGTASATPATDLIGVMPDLRSIIDTVVGAKADVYVRDNIADVGEPHNGSIASSPDIILRQNVVANPQAVFGAGSGTENDTTLGNTAEAGQDNHIYVRVLNQGGLAASNVDATVFWSPVASLVTPALWNLVGSTNLPNVPVGEVLTVSNGITWPAADIPATGHYCFVGLIGNTDDPAPTPADFMDWPTFYDFIRNNNNVTWRNFNVVDNVPPAAAPPGFVPLPLLITGAPDRAVTFAFDISGKLPEGARLVFEAPPWLLERFGLRPGRGKDLDDFKLEQRDQRDQRQESAFAQLRTSGRTDLGKILLRGKAAIPVKLHVHIPKEHRKNDYAVYLRQRFEGDEVGRVTWLLREPDKKD